VRRVQHTAQTGCWIGSAPDGSFVVGSCPRTATFLGAVATPGAEAEERRKSTGCQEFDWRIIAVKDGRASASFYLIEKNVETAWLMICYRPAYDHCFCNFPCHGHCGHINCLGHRHAPCSRCRAYVGLYRSGSAFHGGQFAYACSGRQKKDGCPRQAGGGVDAKRAKAAYRSNESIDPARAQTIGQSAEAHDAGTAQAIGRDCEAAVGENRDRVTTRKACEVGASPPDSTDQAGRARRRGGYTEQALCLLKKQGLVVDGSLLLGSGVTHVGGGNAWQYMRRRSCRGGQDGQRALGLRRNAKYAVHFLRLECGYAETYHVLRRGRLRHSRRDRNRQTGK